MLPIIVDVLLRMLHTPAHGGDHIGELRATRLIFTVGHERRLLGHLIPRCSTLHYDSANILESITKMAFRKQ